MLLAHNLCWLQDEDVMLCLKLKPVLFIPLDYGGMHINICLACYQAFILISPEINQEAWLMLNEHFIP